MAELVSTYTDAKNNIHTVQHVTPTSNSPEKQQMTEELFRVLSKKDDHKTG